MHTIELAFPNLLIEGNFTYYSKLYKKYLSDKWTFKKQNVNTIVWSKIAIWKPNKKDQKLFIVLHIGSSVVKRVGYCVVQ